MSSSSPPLISAAAPAGTASYQSSSPPRSQTGVGTPRGRGAALSRRGSGTASPTSATRSPSRSKHVYFAWRSPQDVNYVRVAVDEDAPPIPVLHPETNVVHALPAHLALLTEATVCHPQYTRACLRCPRYELRGCCEDGPRCPYVHVVVIDEALVTEPKRRQRPGQSRRGSQVAASVLPLDDDHVVPAPSVSGSGDDDNTTPAPSSHTNGASGAGWWRHDPYDETGALVRNQAAASHHGDNRAPHNPQPPPHDTVGA